MPCVPTLKDPTSVAVFEDTREMEGYAQVCQFIVVVVVVVVVLFSSSNFVLITSYFLVTCNCRRMCARSCRFTSKSTTIKPTGCSKYSSLFTR